MSRKQPIPLAMVEARRNGPGNNLLPGSRREYELGSSCTGAFESRYKRQYMEEGAGSKKSINTLMGGRSLQNHSISTAYRYRKNYLRDVGRDRGLFVFVTRIGGDLNLLADGPYVACAGVSEYRRNGILAALGKYLQTSNSKKKGGEGASGWGRNCERRRLTQYIWVHCIRSLSATLHI